MAERFPAGRLITIGGGHEVHDTRLAEFLAALATFLPRAHTE